MKDTRIKIIPSGLGKMGAAVVEAALKADDIKVSRLAFGGNERGLRVIAGHEFEVLSLVRGRQPIMPRNGEMPQLVVVDYSTSDSVVSNAEYCVRNHLPLVIGTSVDPSDRERLEGILNGSQVCAVVAPNMARPIVALQRALERAAYQNPDSLKGYKLDVVESHQATKKGTSATAKAIIEVLKKAGAEFGVLTMLRTRDEQLIFGVPEEHLNGHGHHTYALRPRGEANRKRKFYDGIHDFLANSSVLEGYSKTESANRVVRKSEDGTVSLEAEYDDGRITFSHDVNGRAVYALGTLDAVRFAHGIMKGINGGRGRVHTMIDVIDSLDRKAA